MSRNAFSRTIGAKLRVFYISVDRWRINVRENSSARESMFLNARMKVRKTVARHVHLYAGNQIVIEIMWFEF